MLRFIKKNTKDYRDPSSLKTFYNSFVRFNLEFGSIINGRVATGHIQIIWIMFNISF